MANEKATDQFVRDLLREIGVTRPWEQDGGPQWKRDALRGGSKSLSAAAEGKPEFVFQPGEFIVVVEDKKDVQRTRYLVDGVVDTEHPYRADYALNGAIHYAQAMLRNGVPQNKGIFAVGIGGAEVHHEIAVAYLAPGFTKLLDDLDNLDVFAVDQIGEYYAVQVLGQRPRTEAQLDDLRSAAERLHEGMRNYGSVENDRKAPLISAILLALQNPYFDPSRLQSLTPGNNYQVWDGRVIYDAAEQYMRSEALMPQAKIGTLLDQFAFIKNAPQLNRSHRDLGESPLKWMTRILENDVLDVVTDPSMTAFDVLGNFYHEFISYGGGDGSGLGIVLTPEHVTTLMAELIDVNATDYVLDPTAGTASFLIAAMQRMFTDAGDNVAMRDDIRRNRLYGIELQDKLFAIGTTNMILRGDGKANFRRDSIFEAPINEMRGDVKLPDGSWAMGHGFTKVLLNPPYSQSKDKRTRNLSELAFVERALSFLNPGGKLAVIVPQSAMVGKTREDKARKKYILEHHTLDTVITMNPMTFVNSGHTPHTVIVTFTAGRPHPKDHKVRFVNFEKDGWIVAQHRGLVDDGTVASRRKHLMEVLRGDAQDDTCFIVRSEVTADDEWQHSYFYFNDQPPTYEDFLATIADYVAWQVDMHAHGFGDLITPAPVSDDAEPEDEVTE
ncbi:SAM-dependent DNA methyltransferase [Propionibacterium freudenreichii]|nr:SAM-dependent DNA methyltransferase [Propionibacterium freudenreichii]